VVRDSPAYSLHLSGGNRSCWTDQPLLTHRSKLISHGLRLFSTKRHLCFAWVEFASAARQGHDLDFIEELIGRIIAYNNGWPLLADFTSDRRIEVDLQLLHV
jgi:hypothetical protein